jgi:hypothetical protein
MVYAELPNQETEPKLYEIVKRSVIHGPCGNLNLNSVCMIDCNCDKRYPKVYEKTTRGMLTGILDTEDHLMARNVMLERAP